MTGTEAEKAAVATLRAIKRIEKKGKRSEERRQREALLECARKNLEVELYGRGV